MLKTILSQNTASVNPLDEAERAINNKDYPALAAAAAKIAALVPDNRYLVEPLHVIATRLAETAEYIPAAINAAKVAAIYAPSGSDLERQAVSTWLKHVEALPEAAQRIDAAKVAARYAPSGSDLERQAVSTILKHVEALPEAAQRIDAARAAAKYAPSGSDLARQAIEKLRELQRAPAPDVPTSAAARTFVGKFYL
jgi:hypothetical protein